MACFFFKKMVADPARAKAELKWEATRSIEEACEDGWRWQSNNPNGFN